MLLSSTSCTIEGNFFKTSIVTHVSSRPMYSFRDAILEYVVETLMPYKISRP